MCLPFVGRLSRREHIIGNRMRAIQVENNEPHGLLRRSRQQTDKENRSAGEIRHASTLNPCQNFGILR
jgi:hypothetical protein